jgi:DNA-binding NarL/FixJ family response regulator
VRLTRECLSHLLAAQLADFEIISLEHAREASECSAFRPDVALLNVGSGRLADRPVLDDIAAILAATRHAPVLLLSEHGEADEEGRAAQAGVAGLFPSTCSVSLLIAAIHLVAAGGQFHIPSPPARFMHSRLEGNGAHR